MTRDEAIAIARVCAMNDPEGHSYTPQSSVSAATWMPHEWVIEAIMLAAAESGRLRAWIDSNTTFYNVGESDGPVLASVSKRIWYHATDDTESYPFSAVAEKAVRS